MSDHGIPEKVEALESILVEKGYVHPETLDAIVATYDGDVGPRNGAHVVARSWVDPAYRERLRADATAAIAELGIQNHARIVVLENTPELHNVVVCTLCSCYPIALLGPSPSWYKSEAYRSRVVRDPRGVLHEFGLDLPEATSIAVWDASAESRYMVLPRRPAGTADLTEEQLAGLVTRKGLIGTSAV